MNEPTVLWTRHPIDGLPTFPYGATTDPYGPENPHRGLDYACAVNTPVYAPAAGYATAHACRGDNSKPWGWSMADGYGDGSTGNMVVIDHGDGWPTSLFHLNRFDPALFPVSQPHWVEAGQLIAYSGNTGASTGPHVHAQRDCRAALTVNFADCRNPLNYMEERLTSNEQKLIRAAFGDDRTEEHYRKLVAGGLLADEVPADDTSLNGFLVRRFRIAGLAGTAKVDAAAALLNV